ncbi:hypothetical protein AB1Y20_006354 [Prymnesium parvum]|uniref:Uncharacterized protein n=1 Tax=Prymnesium parvum TaxID=97485 RepID=A0AB34J3W0_PRYPA
MLPFEQEVEEQALMSGGALDRQRLVRRHTVHYAAVDPTAPLSVGNGEFAFTADVTGLQTLNQTYLSPPLQTMSHWGWHTVPSSFAGVEPRQFVEETVHSHGHTSHYPTSCANQSALCAYLRANPHRLNLARVFLRRGEAPIAAEELRQINQTLDLWTARLHSRFLLGAAAVSVDTAVHPTRDLLALRVCSSLVGQQQLAVGLAFPYADTSFLGGSVWSLPRRHRSTLLTPADRCSPVIEHRLDGTAYFVRAALAQPDGGCATLGAAGAPHDWAVHAPRGAACVELSLEFYRTPPPSPSPSAAEAFGACAEWWPAAWREGAAVDFEGSEAAGAAELERRVVLSQYIMMTQEAGSNPPQETGLVVNSWYGKFHLEMRWHHQMHFYLWGRAALAQRADDYFPRARPLAQWHTRQRQGFGGVRWPKMVGPPEHMTFADGTRLYTGPSSAGPWLLWQQPHPLAFAEMAYRAAPSALTLARHNQTVHDTADFMASFVLQAPAAEDGCRELGPPLFTAELESNEGSAATNTSDAAFERVYWRHGLRLAAAWRRRQGLAAVRAWQEAEASLCPPRPRWYDAAHAEVYFPYAASKEAFPGYATQLFMGVFAPPELYNATVLRATLTRAVEELHALTDLPWCSDPPMYAMAAARLGLTQLAAQLLLEPALPSPHSTSEYLPNGHCRMNTFLPVYTPGNGALLAAVAMLAGGGWDGDDGLPLPGLPRDGSWRVRAEGFAKAL